MLPDVLRARFRKSVEPVARFLARTPLTPNALTFIGFLLNVGVGALLALGYIRFGGVLVLAAGLFDTLDGALARTTQQTSKFGALLDSSLDRFSEAVLLLGLLVYYARRDAFEEIILIYVVIVGSIMVSYVRARAEGLGLKCEVGLLPRPERVMLLALGLMIGQVTVFGFSVDATRIALWILAFFANFTAIQRIVHVWQETSKEKDPKGGITAPTKVTSPQAKEKKSTRGKHRPRPSWSD